jgi:hypothetical protein
MEKLRSEERGPIPTKPCSKCKAVKAVTEFHKNTRESSGLRSDCKECRKPVLKSYRDSFKDRDRKAAFKLRYGITMDQWNQMFIDQCGRCVICEVDLPPMGRGVHTDHCHNDGTVRGILCRDCNPALGAFKDNPNLLRKAAEYIEDHTEKQHGQTYVDSNTTLIRRRFVGSWQSFFTRGSSD